MNKLFFSLLIIISFQNFAQFKVPNLVMEQLETIDSNKIKEHVTFLADDKLLGRKPGQPGYKISDGE